MQPRMARRFVVASRLALAASVLAVGCGGGMTGVNRHDYAGSITLTLVNSSPRPIEGVFVHPIAKADRGTSWLDAPLSPGASTAIKVRPGGYELVAVSAERSIDERNRETPEAMTMLEIRSDRGDTRIVFHDEGQAVAGLDAPGVVGVAFMITSPPEAAPEATQAPVP